MGLWKCAKDRAATSSVSFILEFPGRVDFSHVVVTDEQFPVRIFKCLVSDSQNFF